jgi:6-pyruvoyltetrahydropterin/6-carboxytetrahydropterin synthase
LQVLSLNKFYHKKIPTSKPGWRSKMRTYYRFRFYLNARHSVTFDGKISNIHPHTWEVAVTFGSNISDTVNFTMFEGILEEYFEDYEGKYLNEHKAFVNISPTMENMGKVFYNDIKELVNHRNLHFDRLEISENPTRTYIIE